MEREYLTPPEALHALASGKTLENDDGVDLILDGSYVVMRYVMGRKNEPVSQNYNGAFDKWFLAVEEEEGNAS